MTTSQITSELHEDDVAAIDELRQDYQLMREEIMAYPRRDWRSTAGSAINPGLKITHVELVAP